MQFESRDLGKNAVEVEKKTDVDEYLVAGPYYFFNNSKPTVILLSVCLTLICQNINSKEKLICDIFQNKLIKKMTTKNNWIKDN